MNYEKPSEERYESLEHIVFLGTYNANPFMEKIHDWLPKLDLSSTTFVIADNASTDGSETWLSKLCSTVGAKSHFLQNLHNYGGYGNLISTIDKFPDALWITTLHQDDFYSKNHVQNHRQIIRKSAPNLGMVCSEAVSIDTFGHKIPYPRASWLLKDQLDPVTVFLAHLRQHVFPFSGASISTHVLRQFEVPWHSTAFPDTELVMKMIAEFSVEFAEGLTVQYLENPKSESHSLSMRQREIGTYVALSRIFAHANFKRICNMVPSEKRRNFYLALSEGIQQRFTDSSTRELLTQAALEIVAEHIGMDQHLAETLALGYEALGDHQAVARLEAFNNGLGKLSRDKVQDFTGTPIKPAKGNKGLLLRIFGLFPRKVRKSFFRWLMSTKFGKVKFPNWNLLWDEE